MTRRLKELIQHKRLRLGGAQERIRILSIGARRIGTSFEAVAGARLQRRKLRIEYHSRSRFLCDGRYELRGNFESCGQTSIAGRTGLLCNISRVNEPVARNGSETVDTRLEGKDFPG